MHHMLEDSNHVNTCDAVLNTCQVRSGEQHNKDSHPVNEYLGIIVSLTSGWCQNIFKLAMIFQHRPNIGKLRNYVLLLNRVGDDNHFHIFHCCTHQAEDIELLCNHYTVRGSAA